ncbi:MAG: phosphoglycerate mutase family protein [Candidatus Pacearchaeota archaeon]|jgi:broad specificity phosphatase PhoE
MKIYLVRHAHYLPDREYAYDGDITDKGRKQIEKLAERMIDENVKFKRVCSSQRIRAIKSAELFCKILGIEERLISYNLDEEYPNEENLDVSKRMRESIEEIECEGDAIIFSHGYAIKRLLSSIDSENYLSKNILPHAGIVLLDCQNSNIKIEEYSSNLHIEEIESF